MRTPTAGVRVRRYAVGGGAVERGVEVGTMFGRVPEAEVVGCGTAAGAGAVVSPGSSRAPIERSRVTMAMPRSTGRPVASSTSRNDWFPSIRESTKYSSGPTAALSGSNPGLTRNR